MLDHIPFIVEAHAEDAAALWLQRDAATEASHYSALFLARLDERLEAAVDGLRVAGEAGWRAACAAFDAQGDPGETFALAVLAFGAHGPGEDGDDRIERVLEALAEDPESRLRPVIAALGWLDPSELRGRIGALFTDPRPAVRVAGLGACSAHRVDPCDHLMRFLRDAPVVRARALRLAGELGRADLLTQIVAPRGDDDAACRFRAAWSAVLLGDRGAALEALLAMAEERMAEAGRLVVPETGTDPAQEAFDAAIRAMDGAAARRWLGECGTGRAATALKVRAAGALGDPATVPWLIQRMEQTDHAKAAGEAFALLTGADLDYLDLDGAAPSDAPEGPSDNPSDPRTALDADEDLPWPDPGAVAGWWEEIRATLPTGPLFLGRASTSEAWCVGLAEGYQRQRRAAALHIALADPVAPLPTWRTRCD